jgi:putative sigma-54 modulation protein
MQLNVSGHHVEITDSLRDYVGVKIEKIARHFDIMSDTEEDMYAAIDGLVNKLERRVRKYKEKLVDHHARDNQKSRYA